MPGLLDDLTSSQQPTMGLLRGSLTDAGTIGLLGQVLPREALANAGLVPRERDPNAGFLDTLLGKPGSPQADAMMALSVAMMQGKGFGNAMAAFNQTYADAEDRNLRRLASTFTLGKSALDLAQSQGQLQRTKSIQDELAKLESQRDQQRSRAYTAGQIDSTPTDQYGTAGVGGVPLFSMGGAAAFGSQPIGAYSPPQPAGGMRGAMQSQPRPFNVGGQSGGNLGAYTGTYGEWSAGGPQQQIGGQLDYLMRAADVYRRNGDMKTYTELLGQAEKLRDEFATDFRQVKDPNTGRMINVMVSKGGRVVPVPFGVKPDIELRDLGGTVGAIDKNDATNGQMWGKTPTYSDRIAAANQNLAERRFAMEASSPQYMQTDAGLVALPKRPGAGPISAQVVNGPNGEPLSKPLAQIPPNVNAAMVTNAQNLQKAETALSLLRGQPVNGMQADPAATGWKGYLPNPMLNRIDPQGVDTRAAIADLGSMVIHDRSGTAVTAAEFPRLAPFIPTEKDDNATAQKKLQRFVDVYRQEAQSLNQIYGKDNGYRPNPVVERSAQGSGGGEAMPLPANPTASTLQRGQAYTLPNGKVGRWDGMQFRVVK